MHRAVVGTLVVLAALGGMAGVGGATHPAPSAATQAMDVAQEPVLAAENETVTTTATESSLFAKAKKVGFFFVRFGPSIFVVTFLAWILLGRE